MKNPQEYITLEVNFDSMQRVHGKDCLRCSKELDAKEMTDSLTDALYTSDAAGTPFVFSPLCAACLKVNIGENETYIHQSEFRAYGN